MKKLVSVMMGLCVGLTMRAGAQAPAEPPSDSGDILREGRPQPDLTLLTEAQRAQVKAILAKYDPKVLTAEQARAIHEAFRQAGLRAGPAMGDVIREAGFDPERLRELAPPPNRRRDAGGPPPGADAGGVSSPREAAPDSARPAQPGPGRYSLEQAISDRAQMSTIAFSGLAFITGDFGASTFIPPGKVCDYFGFQYLRDIDAAGKGHNPLFLDRVAGNILRILSDEQRKLFADLAKEQAPQFNDLALKRFPLIQAFWRQLTGDLPAGSAGLSQAAVSRYVGDLFAFDAELGYQRARLFGKIAASLTAEQKAAMATLKFGDFNTWPEVDLNTYKLPKGTEKLINVAYMTYASEFFSWYAGNIEADTYFCPERHGTYFGGFYLKDMPAMGQKNYDISTSLTGDSGENFLKLLTAEQRAPLVALPDAQRQDLKEIIEVRRALSMELRRFLKDAMADQSKVLALGRRYGELDGKMSWRYAMAFAQVRRTLTDEQRAAAMKLRDLSGYKSAPAYLYSQPLASLPPLPGTDFLFDMK